MKVNFSEFSNEVYSIIKDIPKGKVMTYGKIAELIGRPKHARFVGQALHSVPQELNLPCHRVVNSSGRIAPNWPEQRNLLEKEGISFKKNGCVDMEKHLWRFDDLLSE